MKQILNISIIIIILIVILSCIEKKNNMQMDIEKNIISIYEQKINIPKEFFDVQLNIKKWDAYSYTFPYSDVFDFRLLANNQIFIRKKSGDSLFKKNNTSYYEFEFQNEYKINSNIENCRTLIGIIRDSVKFYEHGFHGFYIIWKDNPDKNKKGINWYPDSKTEFIISNLKIDEIKSSFPEFHGNYFKANVKKIKIFPEYSTSLQEFYDDIEFIGDNEKRLFK